MSKAENGSALAVIDALPVCTVCEENGRKRRATRYRKVGFGRWFLCDEHGRGYAEMPYASALRDFEKASVQKGNGCGGYERVFKKGDVWVWTNERAASAYDQPVGASVTVLDVDNGIACVLLDFCGEHRWNADATGGLKLVFRAGTRIKEQSDA